MNDKLFYNFILAILFLNFATGLLILVEWCAGII